MTASFAEQTSDALVHPPVMHSYTMSSETRVPWASPAPSGKQYPVSKSKSKTKPSHFALEKPALGVVDFKPKTLSEGGRLANDSRH